jgi:hypothetical protein
MEKKLLPKKEILRSKPGPDHPWRKPWKKKIPWIKKPLTDIFTGHQQPKIDPNSNLALLTLCLPFERLDCDVQVF